MDNASKMLAQQVNTNIMVCVSLFQQDVILTMILVNVLNVQQDIPQIPLEVAIELHWFVQEEHSSTQLLGLVIMLMPNVQHGMSMEFA